MPYTREEAKKIYDAGPEAVADLIVDLSVRQELAQRQVQKLEERVRVLGKKVAQLSKNSSNSSKPPSSDITQPKRQDEEKKSKNKKKKDKKDSGSSREIGAQPGHPKHEREPAPEDKIDHFHHYIHQACPECEGAVHLIPDREPRILQQMEVVENPVEWHEHRCYAVWCESCGKEHWAPVPEHVAEEGLLKERAVALVGFMKHVCGASFSKIQTFFQDVLGEPISRGYLAKVRQKVSKALDKPYRELLERLPLEALLNVDETGHKENGDKFWTWVFRAELYVLFKIDESRGSQVLIDVLGKEFDGVLGCDYFSAYRKYMKDFGVVLQFCLAHLIRNVRYLTGLPDPQTKAYGKRLLEGLRDLFKTIHGREDMSEEAFRAALEGARANIIHIAIETAPSELDSEGKELKREAQNMARRFRKHGEAYFTFITTPGVEPTNNVAERAVRFIVIERRNTQGTRSRRGREACQRIWSVIGTCKLQGRSAFDFIVEAVRAAFHNHSPPSLLPDSAQSPQSVPT